MRTVRAALTGKHDTLVRRAPCQPGALRIHLTRLSTDGLGPRHGEVRRAHQMLNAALGLLYYNVCLLILVFNFPSWHVNSAATGHYRTIK